MIKLTNVSKKFGSRNLFKDLTIEINDGDFLYIVGASGRGKSTLLYILSGLEPPTIGNVSIDKTKKLGFLFQNFALVEDKKVSYNLNLTEKYPQERINSVFEQLNLSKELINEYVYTLSGGEKQRIALARQLLRMPDVYFCDEPTGNLDSDNERLIIEQLESLNDKGHTIVIVTHNRDLTTNHRVIDLDLI